MDTCGFPEMGKGSVFKDIANWSNLNGRTHIIKCFLTAQCFQISKFSLLSVLGKPNYSDITSPKLGSLARGNSECNNVRESLLSLFLIAGAQLLQSSVILPLVRLLLCLHMTLRAARRGKEQWRRSNLVQFAAAA